MQILNFQWTSKATSVALSFICLLTCTTLAHARETHPAPNAGAGAVAATATPAAPVSTAARTAAPLVLVLGDSLSAEYGLKRGTGWAALLQQGIDQNSLGTATSKHGKPVIRNASISGETTAGGRARLAELLEKNRPAITIIELGANDALRGLDLSMTEKNLREMTRMAQRSGSKVLILGMQIPPNFGKVYAERFRDLYSKVAQSEKATLVPFLLEGVADRIDLFQQDRIHPVEAAQPRMMSNVLEGLKKLW